MVIADQVVHFLLSNYLMTESQLECELVILIVDSGCVLYLCVLYLTGSHLNAESQL